MNKHLKNKIIAYSTATCSAVLLLAILSNMIPVADWLSSLWVMLNPVVIGIMLAFLINPLMNFIENKILRWLKFENLRHTLSAILAIVIVITSLVLFGIVIVPAITNSVKDIINKVNDYGYENISKIIDELNEKTFNINYKLDIDTIETWINSGLDETLAMVKNNLSLILNKITTVSSTVFNTVIGFIIGIYFLFCKKSIINAFAEFRHAIEPDDKYKENTEFFVKCNNIFVQYFCCNLFDAIIIGVTNAILMLIFKMDNIALISLVVALTNLLPTFGPIIGCVIGALFLFITNPSSVLTFCIFTLIIQLSDGYLIKPKLFSSSLGISPVLSLIAIILGGKMFGIMGIFLAIPVTAVLVMIYKEKLIPYLKNRTNKKSKINEEQLENKINSEKEIVEDDGSIQNSVSKQEV